MSATERTGLLSPESNSEKRARFQVQDDSGSKDKRDKGSLAKHQSTLFIDRPRSMTFSRRLAMYLSRYSWYNPHVAARREYDDAEAAGEAPPDAMPPPSLAAAWSYFEHVALPRHFLQSDTRSTKDVFEKAEVGEDQLPTRLYSVWKTQEDDLAHFGIGVGLYFFTLRCLAIILFVAGCINIPNILFYSSDWYNHDVEGGVDPILSGSAICTDELWLACPTCTQSQWDYFPHTFDRYAESADGSLKFIKVNHCPFFDSVGYLSFFSLMFVFVSICFLCYRVIKHREVKFDEAAQTTTDYSVQVENPPKDARDADEWKEFFSQFGQVACCTVALDNEELVRALVERRKLLIQLSQLRPPGVKFDKSNLDEAVANAMPLKLWQKLMFYSDAESLRAQVLALDEQIHEFSKTPYDALEVFVIFETEHEQRKALKSLSVRRWDALSKKSSALPKNLLFRGNHLLEVREPPEPSAVRWEDLDKTLETRVFRQAITSMLTLACILGGCILIRFCRDRYGAAIAALVISALNTAAPYVCQFITNYEFHRSEGSKQASRYRKITAFLWVFTALITSIVTPFTDTISNDSASIIRSLYAIYVFELLRGPVTQALDFQGHFYRHVLGPRATDQETMNLRFQGSAYELSERYTNMTSVLFLTFYYGTIFPAGFFFSAGTLVVHYWTDKFCLLRVWAQAPCMGTQISLFCRTFIVVTLVVFAFISSYYIASFPFDNVCDDPTTVAPNYVGNWTVTVTDGSKAFAVIEEGDKNHFYCYQDMLRYKPPAFPAVPSNQPEGGEWMSPDQEVVSELYGWTSVVVLAAVAVILLGRLVLKVYRFLFTSPYQPSGKPGECRFSDVTEIYGYVPQVRVEGLHFPFLVCDVSEIDSGLIGWHDPYLGDDAHNVLKDVPELIGKEHLFSVVKDWRPSDVLRQKRHVLRIWIPDSGFL